MPDKDLIQTSYSWLPLRRVLMGLGLIAGMAGFAPASADGGFVVNNLHSRTVDGVVRIDADIDYRLSPVLRDALHNGVDLVIEMQMQVERVRDWWVDEDIASLSQRYLLGYYSLSRLYVVQNLNTGVQTTYPSLGSALYALGAVRDFPLIDAALLQPGQRYEAGLRTQLAVEQLPLPLRVRAYVSGEWRPESDWYRWSLP